MHLIRMPFGDSVKCTLTNVQTILSGWYYWIFDKLFLKNINVFLCTLCSPATKLSLLWFKLDPSVLHFLTFFTNDQFSWQNSPSRNVVQFVAGTTKNRCSIVSRILWVWKIEWFDRWRSSFIYILMVSRLLNIKRETLIVFQVNYAETVLLSRDIICLRKYDFDTFRLIQFRIYNFRCSRDRWTKLCFSETILLY